MGQRLKRRIGEPAAKRMMMTGGRIGAVEAKELGLVDLVAPAGGLDALVAEFSAPILENSWHTNFAAKRMMRETSGMGVEAGLEYEQAHYTQAMRRIMRRGSHSSGKTGLQQACDSHRTLAPAKFLIALRYERGA
jgi:enoyl-CoA hydratase/carnithine racemase